MVAGLARPPGDPCMKVYTACIQVCSLEGHRQGPGAPRMFSGEGSPRDWFRVCACLPSVSSLDTLMGSSADGLQAMARG